ncbi:unnamed protein product [Medioppia subpectinata]|uniref:beta-N-acetylhexosaminidase n=1 Tax=Medioppia subpectinata TaxID=1979941 RepID=A0A7R9QKJ9_9ACAR|nr:unnamed protein product [Medioppia subpectinata]CAG2121886.1 unnamed protein product [Medioppia subpectinata]
MDLKGAPPLPRFYTHLFPLLAALGANALLVEYEDMVTIDTLISRHVTLSSPQFPFSGAVAGVRALNAYSEAEVRRLVAAAAEHGLEVIPLVQTFGHLEFVLKVEEFAHLREVPPLPQALCPSNNASLPLVREMANQVMRLHPKARFLHIGCDEVFQLGVCAELHAVADHVVRAHGVIPIVWDDMLRQMSVDVIRESGLAALGVELMLWSYVKDIYRFIPSQQFQQFAQLFPRVWFASAFKGQPYQCCDP